MLIAVLTGRTGFSSIGMLLLFVAVFILRLRARPAAADRAAQSGAGARSAAAAVRLRRPCSPPADRPAGAAARRRAARDRDRQSVAGGGADRRRQPATPPTGYLEAADEQGLIEGDERRLLQSIVDFGATLVREVMTPRPDIVAIRADATLDELRALFREQEYSRIPVYNENLDNILGIVFVKDLIQLTGAAGRRPHGRSPALRPAGGVRARRPSGSPRC